MRSIRVSEMYSVYQFCVNNYGNSVISTETAQLIEGWAAAVKKNASPVAAKLRSPEGQKLKGRERSAFIAYVSMIDLETRDLVMSDATRELAGKKDLLVWGQDLVSKNLSIYTKNSALTQQAMTHTVQQTSAMALNAIHQIQAATERNTKTVRDYFTKRIEAEQERIETAKRANDEVEGAKAKTQLELLKETYNDEKTVASIAHLMAVLGASS